MKAVVLHGKEDLRLADIPPRPLQAGEVRVAIEAALTCGTDLKVFKRGYHAKMISPPAVFGHELAGRICEVGPGVADWRAGDAVVAGNSAPCGRCRHCQNGRENLCDDLLFLNGAYAESVVIPERIVQKNLLRLKPGTAFADAALAEPLACVALGWEELLPRPGQRALVIGSGPIGLMFAALARHGHCAVTLAGRGAERLAAAARLGAEIVDMSGRSDLAAAAQPAHGGGFDLVIEAVGKPETWEAAIRLAGKGGKVNLFGGCPAGSQAALDTGLLHYSSLTLLSSFHHTPRAMRRALELIETGVVSARDFVTGECALADLPALFRSMSAGNRAVKTRVRTRP
ncbi:MAG TPA: alcohol dehydrogenase catalytic domain-containing protein [Candidatus Acidoferrum sp.]|nr:alcohol dehydrogenase catalytic domain-containing protein [Candidatus Acidoferrum sp.]